MNKPSTQQSTVLVKISNRLKVGIVLLVVSLAVGWFSLNQSGYPIYAFGGYWGTVRFTSTGIRVSTIIQQITSFTSASFISILGTLVNLSFIVLVLIALFTVWSLRKETLKYVSIALLVVFVANFLVAFSRGATISNWFTLTSSSFYVNFGDFLMGLAILFFLLESFRPEEETMLVTPAKPTSIVTSAQVSRVVRCHVCPLRNVCREANVEASLRLERPLKAKFREDPYAEMQRVTMNCPLKKNL